MAELLLWGLVALNAAWAAWNCYAARANHETAKEIARQLAQFDVLKRARTTGVPAAETQQKGGA